MRRRRARPSRRGRAASSDRRAAATGRLQERRPVLVRVLHQIVEVGVLPDRVPELVLDLVVVLPRRGRLRRVVVALRPAPRCEERVERGLVGRSSPDRHAVRRRRASSRTRTRARRCRSRSPCRARRRRTCRARRRASPSRPRARASRAAPRAAWCGTRRARCRRGRRVARVGERRDHRRDVRDDARVVGRVEALRLERVLAALGAAGRDHGRARIDLLHRGDHRVLVGLRVEHVEIRPRDRRVVRLPVEAVLERELVGADELGRLGPPARARGVVAARVEDQRRVIGAVDQRGVLGGTSRRRPARPRGRSAARTADRSSGSSGRAGCSRRARSR